MKKILAGLLMVGVSLTAFSLTAHSVENFDGVPSAEVEINGFIGQDNTDPAAEIPEGHDDWINVDLDTATMFWTTGDSTEIKAPNYSIQNKSGRPVDIKIASLVAETAPDTETTLDLNMVTTMVPDEGEEDIINTIQLVTGNAIVDPLSNGTGIPVGQLVANSEVDGRNMMFTYAGTADATGVDTPSYTMVLEFTAVAL